MAMSTWEKCFLAFCCSFSLFCSNIFAFLDLEELKSVHYDIDISAIPVLLGRPVQREVVHLRSKFGQQYECQLPDMTDFEKEQEEEKLATDMGISELLKPMENAPCLVKIKDWWTYEYCHGQNIKQYHMEDGKIKGDTVYLGYYESEMDWNNKTHKDAKRHRLNRYHSHTYVNGTKCDLTKKPREAEVRFVCAEGEGDSIFRIDEPSSCAYILTIHTSRTCHHPYLRPPPSLKARPVLCYPALDQDQYDKYLEIKQETAKKNEPHVIAIESSENMPKGDRTMPDEDSTPAEEPSTSKTKRKSPLESSLLGDLAETDVSIDGLEEAIANGVDPTQLSSLVKSILKSVQKDVKNIDQELKGTSDKPRKDADDDIDEMSLLKKLDIDALNEDGAFDDGELESLMDKDIGELVDEFREQIPKLTSDPAEMERMAKMVDNIEATLEEIDEVNSLLQEISDEEEDNAETDHDDETSQIKTFRTLKNLINEIKEKGQKLKTEDQDSNKPPTSLSSEDSTKKDTIKLKVTKITLDKTNKKPRLDAPRETEVYDSEHRPIEEAITQQLENAGVDTNGKIEFRIVTYSPTEWPGEEEEDGVTILTEEESNYFKNVVVGLLGGGAESTEQQRQKRLESNYEFLWDAHQGTTQLGTPITATDSTPTDSTPTDSTPSVDSDGEEATP